MKSLILIALVWNIPQKRLKNLLNLIPVGIKTSKQTYLEFKTYLGNSCVFYLLGL